VLPLFCLRTGDDWGIGEIAALPEAAAWVKEAGFSLIQILPPHELDPNETSPYGARTAFGLDPIYLRVDDIADLDPAAVDAALGEEGRREVARVRASASVDHRAVRALKARVIEAAFARFSARDLAHRTARAEEYRAFVDAERGWLDRFALYDALREAHGGWGWETWPPEERDAARAVATGEVEARAELARYTQWLLFGQWERARRDTNALGVALMGDLPFIVGNESADVWSHAREFRRDLSLGAPPDEFSDEGQNWGLPAYDWAAMDATGLAWLRARARHAARLYDSFRLDHVVGFFRMWVRPLPLEGGPKKGDFLPKELTEQRVRGTKVLLAMRDAAAEGGAHIIAEDLGVIPPMVRASLRDLGLPGYKIIPWEKDETSTIRDPRAFDPESVAAYSTHDTQPITAWWPELEPADQAKLAEYGGFEAGGPAVDLALLGLLLRAGSRLALVLVTELIGVADRINLPGTVGDHNWTYRLPAPIADLARDPALRARFSRVREMAAQAGRV
jgi:4-alpha-glucanotransferase